MMTQWRQMDSFTNIANSRERWWRPTAWLRAMKERDGHRTAYAFVSDAIIVPINVVGPFAWPHRLLHGNSSHFIDIFSVERIHSSTKLIWDAVDDDLWDCRAVRSVMKTWLHFQHCFLPSFQWPFQNALMHLRALWLDVHSALAIFSACETWIILRRSWSGGVTG